VKIGIYDRFSHSMGGGERHAGMIGQITSRAGHEVDLIGHSDVSLRDLSDRVALDLSRTRLRVRPDRGEDELSDVTAEYDLLVNATYMSRLVSKARRSAYLCFFPTPFDHDLGPVHRAAVGLVGPHLAPSGPPIAGELPIRQGLVSARGRPTPAVGVEQRSRPARLRPGWPIGPAGRLRTAGRSRTHDTHRRDQRRRSPAHRGTDHVRPPTLARAGIKQAPRTMADIEYLHARRGRPAVARRGHEPVASWTCKTSRCPTPASTLS
jgi:hypothetical protein